MRTIHRISLSVQFVAILCILAVLSVNSLWITSLKFPYTKRYSASTTSIPSLSVWNRYLVEFRGLLPFQRQEELQDALDFFVPRAEQRSLDITLALPDTISPNAICIYVNLPNETIAKAIGNRCASIRSIIEVWGEGSSQVIANNMALSNFDHLIAPHFPLNHNNAWKVEFKRYGRSGRSGLDYAGKRQLLSYFGDLLRKLNSTVNLNNPDITLIYFEDWHDYQEGVEEKFVKCWFGREVVHGDNINHRYDLRFRPFLGTTTMQPVCAHLACVAAQLGPGDLCLDPFCGSGAVPLAAAHLGATAIGSDLAYDYCTADDTPKGDRTWKNRRYKRKDGSVQAGLSPVDNFNFYQLTNQLLALFQADARAWSLDYDWTLDGGEKVGSIIWDRNRAKDVIRTVSKVKVIVTDPPFGRRERFIGHDCDTQIGDNHVSDSELEFELPSMEFMTESVDHMGDPYAAVLLLLKLAEQRLVSNGRLVFWLPTTAEIEKETVMEFLQRLRERSGVGEKLRLLDARAEPLSSALTRWLCVFELNK